jgi:hypothetical protein
LINFPISHKRQKDTFPEEYLPLVHSSQDDVVENSPISQNEQDENPVDIFE